MGIDRSTLRSLFRNYQAFEALYEEHAIDTLTGPDGVSYSLWDLRYLIEEVFPLLPSRQAEAIHRCLIENHIESRACELMGLPTRLRDEAAGPSKARRGNPVSAYATDGLDHLVKWIDDGRLPRFKPESNGHRVRALGAERAAQLTGV